MLKQLLRSALMVAMLALICASLPAAQAAPGDLDPTFAGFGSRGIVIANSLNGRGIVIQPDGKIVIAGHAGNGSMAVLRYQPNGQPDNTFGVNGRATIPASPGLFINPQDVALQADGRIVVAGHNTSSEFNNSSNFLLIRLTASGQLDASFDNEGFVLTDFNNHSDVARKVLIQPDGKIVVAGSARVGDCYDFAVARYNTNGSPDTTFEGGGKVTIPFNGCEFANDMALQSDGKLVVVGTTVVGNDYDFAVARLEADGSLDDTSDGDGGFDDNGKLSTGFGDDDEAMAVAIQADGRIVVAGQVRSTSPDNSFMARYMPNGNLDGTFGSGGKLTIPNDVLNDLALLPDGKMMLLGHTSQDDKLAFHRLLPGGTHDPTFGTGGDGIVWLDLDTDEEYDTDLALLPDGRILAMGSNNIYAVLVRLWPDGYYDDGGKQTHAISAGSYELAHALAVQPDGSFLVAGELSSPNNTSSNAFVTRFLSDGRVDTGFGPSGQGTIHPAYIFSQPTFRGARALAVQPDGKIVMAGYSDVGISGSTADFLVARWHSNGTHDFNFGSSGFRLVVFPGNGDDYATALALAPGGKIVVAGNVWNGSRQVWGVARLTSAGQPDPSFDSDGLFSFGLDVSNAANAVAVQPDGKILVAGHIGGDFAVARLAENGSLDPSFGQGGFAINDLGGNDVINALALASNGWIYAAGSRLQNGGNEDMALAQFTPQGGLAACPSGQTCNYWPTGTFFMHWGLTDAAYALDLRSDNQLVAAGCADQLFAAVQVRTDSAPTPLPFNADFAGHLNCARAVKFSGEYKILLAGHQNLYPISSDWNIALARFETTGNNTVPPPPPTPTPPPTPNVYPVYLPIVVR